MTTWSEAESPTSERHQQIGRLSGVLSGWGIGYDEVNGGEGKLR